MYTDMFVEYINHNEGWHYSEVLHWEAFCDLCMERGIEITFCCSVNDPRLHVDE